MRNVLVAALISLAALPAYADVPKTQVDRAIGVWRQSAVYSFYGKGFDGKRAANGSIYNQMAATGAHKRLPFGTRVRIINPRNGQSEVIVITDRGPFIPGRDFDLSLGTARRLGLEQMGTGKIEVEILG